MCSIIILHCSSGKISRQNYEGYQLSEGTPQHSRHTAPLNSWLGVGKINENSRPRRNAWSYQRATPPPTLRVESGHDKNPFPRSCKAVDLMCWNACCSIPTAGECNKCKSFLLLLRLLFFSEGEWSKTICSMQYLGWSDRKLNHVTSSWLMVPARTENYRANILPPVLLKAINSRVVKHVIITLSLCR